MGLRGRFSSLLALCLMLAVVPASADTEMFDTADSYRDGCGTITLTASCTVDAVATVAGQLETRSTITSLSDGTLPGYASTYGSGRLAAYRSTEGASALLVTVRYRVDEASATHHGGATPVGLSSGRVTVDGSVGLVAGCFDCSAGSFYHEIAELTQGISHTGEHVKTMLLAKHDGSPLPKVPVYVQVGLEMYASLGTSVFAPVPDTGTVSVNARVTITELSIRALS